MKISNQINFNNNYKSTSPAKPKITNFKGWAACPLESITLRPNHYRQFNQMLLELQRTCGQYFKIQVLLPDRLVKDINTLALHENKPIAPPEAFIWMQDYGTFLDDNNLLNFRYLETLHKDYHPDVNLARLAKVKSKDTYIPFEGGNMFLGKKPNGDGYAILGNHLGTEMVYQALARDPEYSALIKAKINFGEILRRVQVNKPKYNGILSDCQKQIADELRIKPKNIYWLRQPSFHLDMVIRPLHYPYVLVGDPSLTIELAEQRYAGTFKMRYLEQMEDKIINPSEAKKSYVDADETVMELEDQGLIPLRVPGLLPEPYNGLNLMNAIVHQDTDGRFIYITNKNGYKDLFGIDFEEIFVDYLKKHVPSIKKVIFIDGTEFTEALLTNEKGGIHCLSLEKPDFKKWDELLKKQRSNN